MWQIGQDLTKQDNLYLVVQGLKEDKSFATYLVTISLKDLGLGQGGVTIEAKQHKAQLFAPLDNQDITKISYCGTSKKTVVEAKGKVYLCTFESQPGSDQKGKAEEIHSLGNDA